MQVCNVWEGVAADIGRADRRAAETFLVDGDNAAELGDFGDRIRFFGNWSSRARDSALGTKRIAATSRIIAGFIVQRVLIE